MTKDEIRQLLAGYATNTLTETERRTLFEAALDDQELFDALHQEQALKDLLADPGSRAQIRQALEKPRSVRPRWWTWTAAASAIAAACLIVAVIHSHNTETAMVAVKPPSPVAVQPAQKADTELKPIPQQAPARASAAKQAVRARPSVPTNDRKFEPPSLTAPAAPAPPPALTASEQVHVTGAASQSRESDARSQSQQSTGQAVTTFLDQGQAGGAVGGVLSKADVPPVRYTLLKRAQDGTYQPLSPGTGLKAGDAVRLSVLPNASGYLSLSREGAAGEWTRVFPATGPGIAVTPNANYEIPASSIDVTDGDQKLRITLVPASMISVRSTGQVKAMAAPLKKQSAANPPFFVDVTIGPKSVP
jgi:hypothetical protein